MKQISVIHGPNLNLLGTREPELYGNQCLDDINQSLSALAAEEGVALVTFQSNAEHEILDRIQRAPQQGIDFILINPAALAHTSVALRDSLLAVNVPFIEVHLSNIFARETFRQHSYLSDIAVGIISGLGSMGYHYALKASLDYLEKH